MGSSGGSSMGSSMGSSGNGTGASSTGSGSLTGSSGSGLSGEDRSRGGASSPNLPRLEDAVHGGGTSVHRSGSQYGRGQNGNGQRNGSGLSGLLGQQGEWAERARSTVREYPLAAIAGALVLGSLLSRRRH